MKAGAPLVVLLLLAAAPAQASYPAQPVTTAPGDQVAPVLSYFGGPFSGPVGGYFWENHGPDATGGSDFSWVGPWPGPQTEVQIVYAACSGGSQWGCVGLLGVWTDGRGADLDIFATEGPWNTLVPWPAGGIPVCDATGNQSRPRVVSVSPAQQQGSRTHMIAWLDDRVAGQTHVYAQLLSDSAAFGWAANGVPVCDAAGTRGDLVAAGDGAGGVYFAWTDSRGGVYLQRFTSAGAPAPGWPDDGMRVCTGTDSTFRPRLLPSGGGGGVLVVWDDRRAGAAQQDVYARRIEASGAAVPGWPASGLPIATAARDQWLQDVVYGDGSSAVCVWKDGRARQDGEPSRNYDLYALRIQQDATVHPAWPASGAVVCDRLFEQTGARAAPDFAGGVYVAWEDRDAALAAPHIRAIHLDGNGGLPWIWPAGGEDGLKVSDAPGAQTGVIVTGFGTGIEMAWVDERDAATTGKDIYRQNMSLYGVLDAPEPESPIAFRMFPVAPNPFSQSTSVRFALPTPSGVVAEVVDVSGRIVRTLVHAMEFPAGTHELRWDGRDDTGGSAVTGMYFLRVRAGASSAVRSMVLMR